MKEILFDWPQTASALVHQAKTGCDLARLIMDGVAEVESWLIAHQILPMLREKGLKTIGFSMLVRRSDRRTAACIPLPDGSAFICNVLGSWMPLDPADAIHEMQYIGSRYAPGQRWHGGFEATLCEPEGPSAALTPVDLARFWMETTGAKLSGFETGFFDHIEAIGYDVADKMFTTQGRLGL